MNILLIFDKKLRPIFIFLFSVILLVDREKTQKQQFKMASSQSFYNNDEAYQTTLQILMATTADVNFIFKVEIEPDTCPTEIDEMGASEMGDGESKMDSQVIVELNALPNEGQIGVRDAGDGNTDNGETSGGKMGDGKAILSQDIDSEMSEMNVDEATNADGKSIFSRVTIKCEKGANEPGTSTTGGDVEKMDSQATVDLNAFPNDGEIDTQLMTQEAVEYEIVKIPAHKQVLAKHSPVFDRGKFRIHFSVRSSCMPHALERVTIAILILQCTIFSISLQSSMVQSQKKVMWKWSEHRRLHSTNFCSFSMSKKSI